jgi:hypothetical protein
MAVVERSALDLWNSANQILQAVGAHLDKHALKEKRLRAAQEAHD